MSEQDDGARPSSCQPGERRCVLRELDGDDTTRLALFPDPAQLRPPHPVDVRPARERVSPVERPETVVRAGHGLAGAGGVACAKQCPEVRLVRHPQRGDQLVPAAVLAPAALLTQIRAAGLVPGVTGGRRNSSSCAFGTLLAAASGHRQAHRGKRAPAYEAGGCRFDPCRRRQLAVAQWREHRPPKAGVARSNRAGEAPRKRPGWMRSLSRKQVRVSRPLGVRVAPLPLSPRSSSGHDAGFHPGSRGSSPEPWNTRRSKSGSDRRPELRASEARRRGTQSIARWSSGTDSRLLPGGRRFDPFPGSAPPGG